MCKKERMNDYILFGIVLLLLDIPFIKFVVLPLYKNVMTNTAPNVFYIICAYSLMILSWKIIQGNVLFGALTGLILYGVYAFTLLTILSNYTLQMGMTEIIWGTFLFTTATFLTNKLKNYSSFT
jgi:uncharacterized membrane protein